ncbi:phenylacetate--CoA ligase, partial [Acinetobacter baumannii]
MTRMNRVRARIDDMLIIRGVNVFPSEIEKALLQIEELAPHYQLFLERDR